MATLSITKTTANKTTSQISTVNIYDKQQTAQVQFKYKDTGSLDLIMKSDDVIKIKKGQPLALTIKATGAKKGTSFDASISGNFTTLNVTQEEEHDNEHDRKQKKFTLLSSLNSDSTREYYG